MLQQSRELVKTHCVSTMCRLFWFLCKNRQLRAGDDLSFSQNSLSLSEHFLRFLNICKNLQVYELEKKNQEIMHDIERLRRSHPAKENKARGGGGTMSELQGLRSHKMELESRLDELQCARRDLMEELDELMKLLKVQPMPPQPQQLQVTSQQPHQIHHQNHFQQQFHEVTQPHYHIQQIQPGMHTTACLLIGRQITCCNFNQRLIRIF